MKVLFILAAIALIIGLIYLVMVLWNWLIPELFKGPKIKFKHAFGLLVLSKLLFGFGGGMHGGGRWHHWNQNGTYSNYNHCGYDDKDAAPYNEHHDAPKDTVK